MLVERACSILSEYEMRVGVDKLGCTPPGTSKALTGGGAVRCMGLPPTKILVRLVAPML